MPEALARSGCAYEKVVRTVSLRSFQITVFESSERKLNKCRINACQSGEGVLFNQRLRRKGWQGLLLVVLIATPIGGQTPSTTHLEVIALPPNTGAPITIVPTDRPDIDCSIQEWNGTRPKPYLKLLCPPEGVYAPVRVYLELSWMKPEDIAKDVDKIVGQPKQLTKIRSSKSVVMVRMEVSQGKDQHPRVKWVDFNGVMDLALITDNRRR